jgi:hypothetical protein
MGKRAKMSETTYDCHAVELYYDEGLYGTVICPYEMSDEKRPCWPVDTEQEDRPRLPLDAGGAVCTYCEWFDNLDMGDCVAPFDVGAFAITADWSYDYPRFYIYNPNPDVVSTTRTQGLAT